MYVIDIWPEPSYSSASINIFSHGGNPICISSSKNKSFWNSAIWQHQIVVSGVHLLLCLSSACVTVITISIILTFTMNRWLVRCNIESASLNENEENAISSGHVHIIMHCPSPKIAVFISYYSASVQFVVYISYQESSWLLTQPIRNDVIS